MGGESDRVWNDVSTVKEVCTPRPSSQEHPSFQQIPDQDLRLWSLAGDWGEGLLQGEQGGALARQVVRPRVHQLRYLQPRQRRVELRRGTLGDVQLRPPTIRGDDGDQNSGVPRG